MVRHLALAFAACLVISGCGGGPSGVSGRSGLGFTAAPPPNPIPNPGTLTPSEQEGVDALANNVKQNLQACDGQGALGDENGTANSLLGAVDEGARGINGGRGAADPACMSYLREGLRRLAALEAMGIFPPGTIRNWVGQLLDWIFRRGQINPVGYNVGQKKDVLLTVFFSTAEGTHRVGGNACPAGSRSAGSAADCGGGNCYGNQIACKIPGKVSRGDDSAQVAVLDVVATREGAHVVGGPGCPAGYNAFGSVADCGGGNCYGNQLFCMKLKSAAQLQRGERVVQDFVLTAEGAHVVGGPGCPAGYRVTGSIADCGGGRCYGNQLLCVKDVSL